MRCDMDKLDILLDKFLIYDVASDCYKIGRRSYHDKFLPELQKLHVSQKNYVEKLDTGEER